MASQTQKGKIKKTDNFQIPREATEPVIKWIIMVEFILLISGILYFTLFQGLKWACSFLIGGLLVSLNFIVLARILPHLVVNKDAKSSIFSLLVSFYSKLIFTGIILLITIVFLKMPIYPLVIGLSTIVMGTIFWIVKYIITTNHKEADGYVRSSSSRITS
ncbi:hypothetical protein JCM12298_13250 [Desulfothermus naphthae]